jgi:hypothetical protein
VLLSLSDCVLHSYTDLEIGPAMISFQSKQKRYETAKEEKEKT